MGHNSVRIRAVLALALVLPAVGAAQELTDPQDLVRVSVKHVLDEDGDRSRGYYDRDEEILEAIDQANVILRQSGASWELLLTEIVDVDQLSDYHDLESFDEFRELEDDVRRNSDLGQYRSDAINIYLVDDLPGGGVCSFPTGHHIIAINNSRGIPNNGAGWLHEIGHYFSLTHTFECYEGDCDPTVCTGAGAFHARPRRTVDCPENCDSDRLNVMSYYAFPPEDGLFTECQIREMDYELYDPNGRRSNVLVPRETAFLRGDTNSTGRVDIGDAGKVIFYLFRGESEPSCLDTADINDDGRINLADPVALLNYLFRGELPPSQPWGRCAADPTADNLDCDSFEPCL